MNPVLRLLEQSHLSREFLCQVPGLLPIETDVLEMLDECFSGCSWTRLMLSNYLATLPDDTVDAEYRDVLSELKDS